MRTDFLKTSYAARALRITRGKYLEFEQSLEEAYKGSKARRMLESLRAKAVIAFCCSFPGRISEIGDGHPAADILDNSKIAKRMVNFYNQSKVRLSGYFKDSKIVGTVINIKGRLHSLSVKAAGAILLMSVLINIALFLSMRSHISAFGWAMRGMLLFAALWALFYRAGWVELKKTSWFIKTIEKENR